MADSTKYLQAFDELASHYEETVDQELRKFWGVGYSTFVDQLIERLPPESPVSILDVATGTGLIPRKIAQLHPAQDAQVCGLDLSFNALDQAKQKTAAGFQAAGVQPAIRFVQASAHQLPFAPGSFDCVICALATHHLERTSFLSATWDVLKEGGQLILADVAASPSWKLPGIAWLLRLGAYLYFWWKENPARAWVESQAVAKVYTIRDWEQTLTQIGFTNVFSSRPKVNRWWAPSAMMIVARKPISGALEQTAPGRLTGEGLDE